MRGAVTLSGEACAIMAVVSLRFLEELSKSLSPARPSELRGNVGSLLCLVMASGLDDPRFSMLVDRVTRVCGWGAKFLFPKKFPLMPAIKGPLSMR